MDYQVKNHILGNCGLGSRASSGAKPVRYYTGSKPRKQVRRRGKKAPKPYRLVFCRVIYFILQISHFPAREYP